MGDGGLYFVEEEAYQEHLSAHTEENEVCMKVVLDRIGLTERTDEGMSLILRRYLRREQDGGR